MELTVIESTKNELKVQFSEKDEGFMNLIKTALWEQSETEMAGFKMDHPTVSLPVFTLKVKDGKDAKKVWNASLDSISEQLDSLGKEVKKLK
ncbi:MAG: RpoL/Rpb11 RNA polymerase subunit family protein [Nanoarchaeota archaeon]